VKGDCVARITALRHQKRNPDRVSVFLDGQFRIGLSGKLAANLQVGQELSEEDLQDLLHQEQSEAAYKRVLLWISRRPHSIQEIRRKLEQKQAQQAVINDVIERLESLDLVNDERFAEAWVENRKVFRPRARKALRLELRKKGIQDVIIDRVLEDFDEEQAAHDAAQKAIRRYRTLPRETAEQRMLAYLARRGFGYGLCRRVVTDTLDAVLVSEEESEVEI
jgi:regulatory protein